MEPSKTSAVTMASSAGEMGLTLSERRASCEPTWAMHSAAGALSGMAARTRRAWFSESTSGSDTRAETWTEA